MLMALPWMPLALLVSGPTEVSSLPRQEVLAHMRRATGSERLERLPNGLVLTGTARHSGTDGDYRLAFRPDGRLRLSIGGPLAEEYGYDGAICWVSDASGACRPAGPQEAESILAPLWVRTGRWLTEPSPFEVGLASVRSGQVVLELRLRKGKWHGRLLVDPSTWLPVRLEQVSRGTRHAWTFADHRPVFGVAVAHRVTHTVHDMEERSTILKGAPGSPDTAGDPFGVRPPRGTRFDPAVAPELETKRSRTGHLLVHPRVDGRDVGWFIFDSGAGSMVIDRKTADTLGQEAFGEVPAVGVGGAVHAR